MDDTEGHICTTPGRMYVRAYDRDGSLMKTWLLPGTPTFNDLTGPTDVMYLAWTIVAGDGRVLKNCAGRTTG